MLGRGDRLLDLGSSPRDSADERERKRLQVLMALCSVPVVGIWGLTFVAMGHPLTALGPAGYCVGTLLMVGLLGLTGRFGWFRSAHLLLVMLGPFAQHLLLGGFRGSGGAFLWSLVVPMAALIFYDNWRKSALWLAVLASLLAVGLGVEMLRPADHFILTPLQMSIQFTLNAAMFIGFIFGSTLFFVVRMDQEKKRADRLLLNILPEPVAERLKRRAEVIADRFESVTVLFTDLVGFTQFSQTLTAAELVKVLDEVFSAFDEISDRYGLEKIKTIGDAYMVVGGLPNPQPDHARRVASASLEMCERLSSLAQARGLGLTMRVGIHSGEVVAGVIGRRKFSYDLWGDTVNTASRMESHGAPGRIQVSEATKQLLDGEFRFEDRGPITVKGKGEMRTWWLAGRS